MILSGKHATEVLVQKQNVIYNIAVGYNFRTSVYEVGV